MKKFLLLLLLLTVDANAANVPHLKQKTVALPNAELTQKVEKYLNSIKTLEADFSQEAQYGDASSGRFYLQRPGKFRWEYLKGQEVLIISNGGQIAYYDRKLNELTYIPMQYGIAGFLAGANIKLSGDVKLLEISQNAGEIRVVLTQAKKPEDGKLALYFDAQPMKLTHMEVIDQDKNLTAINFKNQKINASIDKEKFVFHDPKFYKNVWDKKK